MATRYFCDDCGSESKELTGLAIEVKITGGTEEL
jgi:hypothetical protein